MLKKISSADFCQISPRFKIRVVDFKTPCLFFRRRGEEFSPSELVPEGICPELFFGLYPSYLSLLYDGQPSKVTVQCSGTLGKTVWRVRGKKLFIHPFLNLLGKFFRFIGKPEDIVDKKIIIELLKSRGVCPKGYSKQLSFSFNHYRHLWGKRYFCPALFYTLYPFLGSGEKNLRLQCPSEHSSIMVELTE